MYELVIEGNALLDGKLNKCCIGINNGIIVAIKKILKGDKQFDFGDKLILPAGIDAHVHFREPGYTAKEDFGTGTLAAAFGGIGSVFDMPNTKPPVVSRIGILEKNELVSKKAYIDYGLYSSVTEKTNIPATAEVCSAFKIYLASSTGNLLFSQEEILTPTLTNINLSSRIPAIHAEANGIIQRNFQTYPPAKSLHDHLKLRPNEAEAAEISKLIDIARMWQNEELKYNKNRKSPNRNHKTTNQVALEPVTRTRKSTGSNNKSLISKQLHICHLSTLEGVNLLSNFREHQLKQKNKISAPVIITTEVTPHHLLLNEHFDGATLGKVNPPLRRVEDQTALWSALADGTIDILASDHAPHTIEEKSKRFDAAPAGLPGVETLIPIMTSHVKHNRLALDRFASAITTKPADLFDIPKGRIEVGRDGDLIVLDFYREEPIKAKKLHSKCGWTPYENMEAIFPIITVVRGKIIVKDGNLEADMGWGKFYN